jgi:hypothetical protein
MELMRYVNAILGKDYVLTYEILPEKMGAFYEFMEGSRTVHEIKAAHEGSSLLPYFQQLADQHGQEAILTRFAESYSGFCLVQYLLNLKDRNNANIMVREDGSIFHIDLAFIFESGPGGLNFESAPFKMTKEFVKVMGGFESDCFRKFEALLVQHFTKVVECKDELLCKINILSHRDKEIRCFSGFNYNDFCKKIPNKLEKVSISPCRSRPLSRTSSTSPTIAGRPPNTTNTSSRRTTSSSDAACHCIIIVPVSHSLKSSITATHNRFRCCCCCPKALPLAYRYPIILILPYPAVLGSYGVFK